MNDNNKWHFINVVAKYVLTDHKNKYENILLCGQWLNLFWLKWIGKRDELLMQRLRQIRAGLLLTQYLFARSFIFLRVHRIDRQYSVSIHLSLAHSLPFYCLDNNKLIYIFFTALSLLVWATAFNLIMKNNHNEMNTEYIRTDCWNTRQPKWCKASEYFMRLECLARNWYWIQMFGWFCLGDEKKFAMF